MNTYIKLLCVLPLFGWTNSLWAQTSSENAALEEMLVTGQKLEETIPLELAQYGNRVEIIGQDAITLGGYNDLSQTLQMEVPGLYIAPKNGSFDYMNCSLQGSRCEDILWLVDGVRINNRLYNSTSPLDTIPAHMIERVEVLYGGQGIFYGTQSVAGVVNVVTKGFNDELGGDVALGADSNDGTHIYGHIGGTSGIHQFALYASKDEADGFRPIPTRDYEASGTQRERGYDVSNLGVKYALNIGDSRLMVHYQNTDASLDNVRPWQQAVAYNNRNEDIVTFKWDQSLSEKTDFYIKAYYHDWDTEWTRIQNDVAGGVPTGTQTVVFRNTFWGYEDYGITAVAQTETQQGLIISAGYDHQRFNGSDDVWLIDDKTESVNALFVQLSNSERMMADTRLALGVRYNKSENSNKAVWNFSGQHNFSDSLFFRGSVGTAFRLPDAEELYLRDCCEVGNPNLDPEESFNANIGVGGSYDLLAGAQWDISAFYRRIENLIDIDFANPAYPDGIFENFNMEVKIQGFELSGNLAFTPEWSSSLDYVYNSAEAEGSSQQIQDIPETYLKLSVDYVSQQLPLEAQLSLVNVGALYDQVSGVGRLEHGGYNVMDLSGAWYLGDDRQHRIGVRAENVTDENYATSLNSGRRDLDNSRYAYRNLGTPRSFHISYKFRF